jgi:hypothetical protein
MIAAEPHRLDHVMPWQTIAAPLARAEDALACLNAGLRAAGLTRASARRWSNWPAGRLLRGGWRCRKLRSPLRAPLVCPPSTRPSSI